MAIIKLKKFFEKWFEKSKLMTKNRLFDKIAQWMTKIAPWMKKIASMLDDTNCRKVLQNFLWKMSDREQQFESVFWNIIDCFKLT